MIEEMTTEIAVGWGEGGIREAGNLAPIPISSSKCKKFVRGKSGTSMR